MGKRYKDIEDLQDAFVDVLKAGFSVRLAEINNSKASVLEIPTIANDSYYDSLDRNASEAAFMLYGVEGVEPIEAGNDVAKIVNLAFIACYDSADDINFSRMMLRVQRAMTEILSEAWRNEIKNDFEIIRTDPLLLSDDSGEFTKASGVIVRASI